MTFVNTIANIQVHMLTRPKYPRSKWHIPAIHVPHIDISHVPYIHIQRPDVAVLTFVPQIKSMVAI